MKKYSISVVLALILILAGWLRFYRLAQNPPSLSWDEAAVGYNAFSIANWGRDEWGVHFPIVFKSFEDYKHPVHIYTTALFIKLLGLSDFTVRLPSALFGLGNVLLIYLVAVKIWKKSIIGLLVSLSMAISPYALQFARFNHEFSFVIFFFLLGFYYFLRFTEGNQKDLFWSSAFFGITLLTYHSAKVVAFPLIIVLFIFYNRELLKNKKQLIIGITPLILVIALIFSYPQLLGLARVKQTSFSEEEIKKTAYFQKTNNIVLGRMEIVGRQYLWHFSPRYLSVSGDKNLRHSTQIVGEFYKTDLIFGIFGLIILIYRIFLKKSRTDLFLLIWILLAPLPSALVNEAPHSARAMFMLPIILLLTSLSLGHILFWLWRKRLLAVFFGLGIGYFYFQDVVKYLRYYFNQYPEECAIEWQYGMKETALAAMDEKYYSVFVTDSRSQPYIFYLYYQHYPLPDFLNTVKYNQTASRSHSLVRSFGKYQFTDWDPIEAVPDNLILYVVTPSQYSGLRNRPFFNWVEVILFPNGSDAFYLVSGRKDLALDKEEVE